MKAVFRSRLRPPGISEAKRVGGQVLWEKRDSILALFVSNDPILAREFSVFAKTKGITVSYAWSLEGLDFLPLGHLTLAVVSSDRWRDHEIFGRPVSLTLQSFPKIIVFMTADELIPGGKRLQANVEYVNSLDEMYAAVTGYLAEKNKESEIPNGYLPQ